MKQILKRLIFRIARSKPGGWMIWFILRYFPYLIPYKKLYQDDFIIAISHPLPSYPVHILILPRIYLPEFLALDMQTETGKKIVQSLFQALGVLLKGFEHKNIQLVINGGDYQDVKLLHMHLIESEIKKEKFEILYTNNTNKGLSDLFTQINKRLHNSNGAAYRLLFSFNENRIQLQILIN
jgi:histidine triad (HIT) family protein